MRSVLSYFDDYFSPGRDAPYSAHSTGQIARHLYELLGRRGECRYVGEHPVDGLDSDLLVGHFWSFAEFRRRNHFTRAIAVYPVADPAWTRARLERHAVELGVPMPWWDLPPASFDHRATMAAADRVLVVGNRFTLRTFPPPDRSKIRLANYAPAEHLTDDEPDRAGVVLPAKEVCYVATHCDLRKGFMDVLDVWRPPAAPRARLHVVGAIRPPWDELLHDLANPDVVYHGFVNSKSDAYRTLIRACRYAYLPTYSEGQVGTLLELAAQGCVPITTRESGLDEHVLDHCLLIEPRDIAGQRAAVAEAMSWSDPEYRDRRDALLAAVRSRHTWPAFEAVVDAVIDEVCSP